MSEIDAHSHVEELLSNPEKPLVLFGVEWCEFCWSVKKLFKAIDAPYQSVELDSAAYQESELGSQIRTVLKQKTGSATIPQIFVGDHHVGGATDTFNAWNSGSLQGLLEESGIAFTSPEGLNPFEMLPGWLHKLP